MMTEILNKIDNDFNFVGNSYDKNGNIIGNHYIYSITLQPEHGSSKELITFNKHFVL